MLPGVFIARGKEDVLVTKNLVPGEVVYGEKKIIVEVSVISKIACARQHLFCANETVLISKFS